MTGYLVLFFGFITASIVISILFRVVVPTNEVHIIQRKKKSVPYGRGESAGNVYFNFPYWVPFIGITRIVLPVSIFNISLDGYEAYDEGKVPFAVDVESFYRINDPVKAAQKITNTDELARQLQDILRGSIRKVLATMDVEKIMVARGELGDVFTKEVTEQLSSWGVEPVKSVELMDIRDGRDSKVISNIMEKKKSAIDKESRIEVANNSRAAQEAEIEAQRQVDISREQAQQAVGEREAKKNQAVGVANEKSFQQIADERKVTTEKNMAVQKVQDVQTAEILKDVNVVKAEEDKQTSIVKAEGQKIETVRISEGQLTAKENEAKGVAAVGKAEADVMKAKEMAPVTAKLELAKGLEENTDYLQYLLGVERIDASEKVGVAKAKALESGDLKVIANTGDKDVTSGVNSILDIFGTSGGTKLAGMLDSFAQTDNGAAILNNFIGKKGKTDASPDAESKAQNKSTKATKLA